MLRPILRAMILSALAAVLLATTAGAQVCFYLDFDDDNDPWTLRTTVPYGATSALVRFIVEVPSVPPTGEEFLFSVDEGCCTDIMGYDHFGTFIDESTATFDPGFVAFYHLNFPLIFGCPGWSISGEFTSDWSAYAPGQRYFFGEAMWDVDCEDEPPPCYPATEFDIMFLSVGACATSTSHMTFLCDPVPTEPSTWGTIKGMFR